MEDQSAMIVGSPVSTVAQNESSTSFGGMVTAVTSTSTSFSSYNAHAPFSPIQSFEAGSNRLEMSLPGGIRPNNNNNNNRSLLPPPPSPKSTTFNPESSTLVGSRRSSKDSVDSVPGVTLDELVDRLTIPDGDHLEHFVRTKIFLMIYRKFLRPRQLLEMLIERFEDLGEYTENDEINNTTRD
ncbi:hypothetical protein BGZ76_001794, partial [Entomortierella beljakovae]